MKIAGLLAQRTADAFQHRPVTIACLGDSVTHGCFEVFINRHGNVDTRYAPNEGYVRRLQDRLFTLYPAAAVTVINCGISGDSSTGALNRFDRDVARFNPDLVIVDLGLNDSMNKNVEEGIANYDKAMRAIFAKIQAIGAEAVLLTPNYMCSYVDPSVPDGILKEIAADATKVQNEGILTRYVDAARKAADDMNVPVADAYAVWQAMEKSGVDTTALLSNSINHPTAEMHDIFAAELLKVLLG